VVAAGEDADFVGLRMTVVVLGNPS
jgi:hypothetical protein